MGAAVGTGAAVSGGTLRVVNTTGSAPELVPTDHRGDLYIQPLRNKLLARRLGVRVLSGLHGNVTVPKHGTGVSVGWVAENGAVPDSDVNQMSSYLKTLGSGGGGGGGGDEGEGGGGGGAADLGLVAGLALLGMARRRRPRSS